MADRKQFLAVPESDPDLQNLLKKAKDTPITDEQLREQRISFAFGNAPDSALITKDSIRQASNHIRLSG